MLALHIVLQGTEIAGDGHLPKSAHQRAFAHCRRYVVELAHDDQR